MQLVCHDQDAVMNWIHCGDCGESEYASVDALCSDEASFRDRWHGRVAVYGSVRNVARPLHDVPRAILLRQKRQYSPSSLISIHPW